MTRPYGSCLIVRLAVTSSCWTPATKKTKTEGFNAITQLNGKLNNNRQELKYGGQRRKSILSVGRETFLPRFSLYASYTTTWVDQRFRRTYHALIVPSSCHFVTDHFHANWNARTTKHFRVPLQSLPKIFQNSASCQLFVHVFIVYLNVVEKAVVMQLLFHHCACTASTYKTGSALVWTIDTDYGKRKQ